MSYGILVMTDFGKYHNPKAVFLHRGADCFTQLEYEPDIAKYFAFDTAKECQDWFRMWLIGNKPLRALKYFSVQEIKPGINTLGYIPKVQPENNLSY